MQKDLITTILAAVVGVVVAYFIVNMMIGKTGDFSFNTVDPSSATAEISDPNPEVFNYKALNPTVEVYVGNGESDGTSD